MTATETELHPCACGDPECHEMTRATYARGHWQRAQRRNPNPNPQPDLLPGPDDDLDLGILSLDDGPPPAGPSTSDDGPPPPEPSPPASEDELEPDPPPAYLHGAKPRTPKPGKTAPVRITTATRKDISAKLQLMLFVPGQVWAARDPYCGGTFINQLPETVDALTDIICDSPDLVAFFTGPAGGFMKYMKLILALQPVGVVAWQHHIAHAIGSPETNDQPQPDMTQYAA